MRDLLLKLYPKSWRAEYGDELRGILAERNLTSAIIVDVAVGALIERWRRTEPWIIVGVTGAIWISALFIQSIISPPPYSDHSGIGYGAPVMTGVGCWTALRGGASPARAAWCCMAVLVTPALIVGYLLATGLMRQVVLGPGDVPTNWSQHGFAIATYSRERRAVAPSVLFLLPLYYTPSALLFGWLGGVIGRCVRRRFAI